MITFEAFNNNTASASEEEFIKYLFNQLTVQDSFYTSLQLMYNNTQHFTTINSDICNFDEISRIISGNICVQGGIHTNNHISLVLLQESSMPIFVKDSYIRIKDDTGRIYHILTNVPRFEQEVDNYYIIYNTNCNIIEPSYDQPYPYPMNYDGSIAVHNCLGVVSL